MKIAISLHIMLSEHPVLSNVTAGLFDDLFIHTMPRVVAEGPFYHSIKSDRRRSAGCPN